MNRTTGIVALLLSLMVAFSLAPAMAVTKADKAPAAVEETKKEVDANAKINVNTADVAELTGIPGIGPKTAEAIVAYRKDNGQFKSLDDLVEVKGIGPKKLEKIRPFLQNI